MWFFVIATGVVISVVASLLAGRARPASHPALGSLAGSISLPVLGACVFTALGLARHDAAWTLAWVLLTYAAGMISITVAENLAGRARRAGHPVLGSFTLSASSPIAMAFFWVALGLALHHVDWTTPAVFPLAYAAWAVRRALQHRRNNA